MSTAPAEIDVEVACATPSEQRLLRLRVGVGTTAAQAVQRSGMLEVFTELAAVPLRLGIFGREVAGDQLLRDGDRVEIYRPLTANPKQARRRRVRARSKAAG